MTLTKIGASLSGGADLVTITQSTHNFTVGKVLRSSGSDGTYTTAQANTAANAEVIGIVVQVIDANTFTMALSGRITVDGAVPNVTAGTVLFLSDTSAGDLTSTEPTDAGEISKPVAVVTTANSEMLMVNYRGEVISTATESWDTNGAELILDVDGDTSIHANTDDQIDVQISGADDFRFTANSLNVLSGSTLSIDSGATISNSGTLVGFNSNSFTVTQSSHGLAVGNVVKSSGSNGAFAKARANSAANAEVVGVVTVVSGNDVTITTSGEVDVAAAVPDVAAGTVVFLHQDGGSDEGTLTSTEPSATGEISKPIAIVTHQNSKMVLLPFRGEVIGSNTAAIADDAVTTAKILDDNVTNAKLANMAANTVKVNATTGSANPTDISMASANLSGAIADGDILLVYDASTTSLKTVAKSVLVAGLGGDFSNGGDNGALILGTNDYNSLTLETNNTARMVIAAGGQITKPTQPMFFSALQSHCTHATGDGTHYHIRSSSTPSATWGTSGMGGRQFVVGSCFSGGTFTAPVNGYYLLGANIGVFGTSGSHDYLRIMILTSNGNYPIYTTRMEYHLSGTGQDSIAGGTVLAYMDANDIAYVGVTVSGGSKDADIQGHDDNNPTQFWGILVA